MLSLVNSPTHCFDLVRLPDGAAASAVLATALVAGPADLGRLERVVPAPSDHLVAARVAARDLLAAAGPSPLSAALETVGAQLPGVPGAEAMTALAQAPLCRPESLLAMLRDDVLGWTQLRRDDLAVQRWPRAVAALGDALLAALAGPALPAGAGELLTGPLDRAGLPLGPGDLGPHTEQLLRMLDTAAGLDSDQTAALARGSAEVGGWALDVHRACWAVHVTGRTRPAARAQTALALSLSRREDRYQLAASGALAALCGALQATVVSDVVDSTTYRRLLLPWWRATG